MHGVFIENGLSDWQIIQHENHMGRTCLSGTWVVPKAAIKQGVEYARPMIRILHEDDNSQLQPWSYTEYETNEDQISGTWKAELEIPAGGLYRIETALETKGTAPGILWIFRGDCRLHIGVGDIFVIGGQSNSAGYGKDPAYDPPELGVHLFRNRHTWDLATHPMNESSFGADTKNAEMGVSGNSPYLTFGKTFKRYSHYPVGFIATAMGGMPMKRWKEDGGLYLNMVKQTKACGGKVAGVLWYQGCSDTDEKNASAYKEKHYNMIKAFRKELGYDVPFFTYQLNRQVGGEFDAGWGMVREAQRMASHDLKDVYVLPTIDCSLSDLIHNDAHACIRLGERMAKMCAGILYQAPEYFAPEIIDATISQNTAKLTFNNMKLGFVSASDKAADCGFTFTDDKGEIPYEKLEFSRTEKNIITVHLDREPAGDVKVSHAWQANPTYVPLKDEVTFLPPLSFYEYPVKKV